MNEPTVRPGTVRTIAAGIWGRRFAGCRMLEPAAVLCAFHTVETRLLVPPPSPAVVVVLAVLSCAHGPIAAPMLIQAILSRAEVPIPAGYSAFFRWSQISAPVPYYLLPFPFQTNARCCSSHFHLLQFGDFPFKLFDVALKGSSICHCGCLRCFQVVQSGILKDRLCFLRGNLPPKHLH
jgi:hypothetical protein